MSSGPYTHIHFILKTYQTLHHSSSNKTEKQCVLKLIQIIALAGVLKITKPAFGTTINQKV